ncbi:Fc.00g094240.m01.CDS01 [Cosmosporella sp. VM-42]
MLDVTKPMRQTATQSSRRSRNRAKLAIFNKRPLAPYNRKPKNQTSSISTRNHKMTALRLTATTLRAATCSVTRSSLPAARQIHHSRRLFQDDGAANAVDGLANGNDAKGRTGGGEKLESSSKNAPPKPKVSNASIPGDFESDNLTEEQKKEVDEHKKDFAKKHDHGNTAPDDKVDKKFWSGKEH